MMLAVWAYILYVKKGEVKRYLLVVLFFMLGLMSKPMLVTLPFILLMLDFWPLGRLCLTRDTRNVVTGQHTDERMYIFRLLWEKVPFFALAVVSSVVTFIVQERGGAVQLLKTYSIQTRIINAFVAYIEYIVNMVWPVKLAVLYPHPGNSLPLWKGVVAGLALVLITILVIRKARKIPYITVGWFWYVVTLIPVIGIVQVGLQAMADRYTYITLIGLFVIIAWGANDLFSKWAHRKIWLGTLTAILLPVLIVLTWKQVQYWENNITLYKHTLKHTSNNVIIHNNLGFALDKQSRTEEAIRHYLQALRVMPDYVHVHNNLGIALDKQGRTEEAIRHYLQALRLRPDYAEAHNNLGFALDKQGRTEEAIKHYLQALRLRPDYTEAHKNLGFTLDKQGRTEEAIEHYLQALRLKPDYAEAHNNLGIALDKQGRTEEAIEHYLQALQLKPDISFDIALFRAEVHNNLGISLGKQGRTEEAIRHYLQALRLKPDYAEAHNNLGITLVRKGDIKGAIVHFREALRINPGHINVKNNLNRVLMMQRKRLF
jgi:Flp pilus assembly protein TadD